MGLPSFSSKKEHHEKNEHDENINDDGHEDYKAREEHWNSTKQQQQNVSVMLHLMIHVATVRTVCKFLPGLISP